MISKYPIHEVAEDVKAKLQAGNRLLIQAPPGAGKSTILPLELLNEPWLNGKIIMLEPRRLAARAVAARMASLLNEQVGETVGYRIRFESRVSARTKIEVVTDGILTRMIQTDSELKGVALIIFDEFHERSLQADLALALALQSQQVLRDDLRLMLMSATLDLESLADKLQAPVITSAGRQFPVDVFYHAPDRHASLTSSVISVLRKVLKEDEGDILIFLPGAGEILRLCELIDEQHWGVKACPLYGDLPLRKQQEAIMPDSSGLRKIVVATSIAETSLTIEGVKIVIDGGYTRTPKFDPNSGLTRLETVRVTKDSADQRKGRAGRLGPGKCYRLWSEGTNLHLLPTRSPEILDADLSSFVIELYLWGIKDILSLNWMTPPPKGTINQAEQLLINLEAIENGKITAQGKEMARLPTHPRMAHMLLTAASAEKSVASDIASLLEERDPLPKEDSADLALRVNLLRKRRRGERTGGDAKVWERVEQLADSWRKLFQTGVSNDYVNDYDVGRLAAKAYPDRVAKQESKNGARYKLANGRVAHLQDHDPLVREEWISVVQLNMTEKDGKIFLAAPVKMEDIRHLARESDVVRWDRERECIVAEKVYQVGTLTLSSRTISKFEDDLRYRILTELVREKGIAFLAFSDVQEQWRCRVMSLKKWRPEEEWPDVSDKHLLDTLDEWLVPHLGSVFKKSDFLKLDYGMILTSLLPWNLQNRINILAPAVLAVPSGSNIKLHYADDGSKVVMEVRLQEVFGLTETPTVNEGRNKVMMHLLSPGYKPVQVTQDLKSFWSSAYHEVRKELRMRYPKHHWPEDPWTAQAVRGVKRR